MKDTPWRWRNWKRVVIEDILLRVNIRSWTNHTLEWLRAPSLPQRQRSCPSCYLYSEGKGDTSQGVVYMSLYTLLFAYENEEFSLSKGWLTSPPSWVLCHANIHIFPSSSEPWSSSILIKSSSPTSNLGNPFCRPTLPRAAFALFRVEPGLNKLQSVRYINYHLHQETYQTLGKRFSMTD